jgi:hypothetical protein
MHRKISCPRIAAAIILCASLLGFGASAAFAQAAPASTNVGSVTSSVAAGQPRTDDSSPVGYFVWHNDDGFHLRTHGPGAEHRFVARLTTNGTFKDLDKSMLEKDDHLKLSKNGHRLTIRFHTFDGFDGVSFRVDGGEHLTFNLQLDGQKISTDNIFVGQDRSHPPTNAFRIEI